MTVRELLPTFDIKDEKGATVAERDIQPFRNDKKVFVDLIIARDTNEARAVENFNIDHLISAARGIIFRLRNPDQITDDDDFLKGEITFEIIGLKTPSFQYDILTNFTARVTSALDDLNTGAKERLAVTANDHLTNTPVSSQFMASSIDDF